MYKIEEKKIPWFVDVTHNGVVVTTKFDEEWKACAYAKAVGPKAHVRLPYECTKTEMAKKLVLALQ